MRSRPPTYPRKAHASGQARIQVNGKVLYLGVFGSPESHLRYQQVLADWHAQQTAPVQLPQTPRTVGQVLELFRTAARIGDRPTSRNEQAHFKRLAELLAEFGFADRQAAAFDVDCLEAFRRRLLDRYSRRYAHRLVVRLRTVWRWAERKRLLTASSWAALQVLKLGSGEVGSPILPVPEEDLAATLAALNRIPRAMAELQLLTGARPGEICVLRPEMIDRRGDVWTADLGREHKSGWRGHRRTLYFGPKAQAIIAVFLDREPDRYLFEPTESLREWAVKYGRRLPRNRKRPPGRRYSTETYAQAIEYACKRAGVPVWGPGRLRHNAASRLAAEFSPEVARTVLGHASLAITRVYVADDIQRVKDAMRRTG